MQDDTSAEVPAAPHPLAELLETTRVFAFRACLLQGVAEQGDAEGAGLALDFFLSLKSARDDLRLCHMPEDVACRLAAGGVVSRAGCHGANWQELAYKLADRVFTVARGCLPPGVVNFRRAWTTEAWLNARSKLAELPRFDYDEVAAHLRVIYCNHAVMSIDGPPRDTQPGDPTPDLVLEGAECCPKYPEPPAGRKRREPVSGAAIESLLGAEGQKVIRIARSAKTTDDKMREICGVDIRFLALESPEWAELLGVSAAMIRKTDFWTKDRKTAIEATRGWVRR